MQDPNNISTKSPPLCHDCSRHVHYSAGADQAPHWQSADFVARPPYSVAVPPPGHLAPNCPIHGETQQHQLSAGIHCSEPLAPRSAPVTSGGAYYISPGPHYHEVPVYIPLALPQQHIQPRPDFHPFYSGIPMYSSEYCSHGNASLSYDGGRWLIDSTGISDGGVHHPDCHFAVGPKGPSDDGLLQRSSLGPHADANIRHIPDLSAVDGIEKTDPLTNMQSLIETENAHGANDRLLIIPSTSLSTAGKLHLFYQV